MPRQQMHHLRGFYEFPDDFPECLRRFKEASGLSWSELARRLGTNPLALRRWTQGVQPAATTCWPCRTWRRNWGCPTCCPGPSPDTESSQRTILNVETG